MVGQEKDIIELLLDMIKNRNRKVKETASDCLESFIETLSAREGMAQRDLIHYFVNKVKYIINHEIDPVEVMVCIRCFGHLASLIKRSLGQEDLQNHFLLLFEISQNRVLDDITDSYKNIDHDTVQPENFKRILYRQKQLNSHILAFALIVKEMDTISEQHAKHLLELFMIGVKKHKLFFEGYKKYLNIALVQLVNSLSKHPTIYKFWIKKACGEMLSVFVEMPTEGIEIYDQDTGSIKSASDFVIKLLKQELWNPEVKQDFIRTFLTCMTDFFSGSEFGYDEIQEQGKKLYIPHNHQDQHLTLRLALIFEEIQRSEVFDEVMSEHFGDLLTLITKGFTSYPRTTSLQKLFKSLLSIGQRLSKALLESSTENQDVIEHILESQFALLRELKGDILLDYLRCLLAIPTVLLQSSPKLLEVYRRALLITLETTGPQTFFMIDHVVNSLERILIREEVDMRERKGKFLQEVLPYFAAFLNTDLAGQTETLYTLTVQERNLEKEVVLRKCISFLGGLGSDLHYMAKDRQREAELEQTEGDTLKISIPIIKHRILMNLNHIIKRASQLALESPNEEVQSAACELFHGSVVVLIGKCSQGSQASEDFVDALESSLPSIVKLAIGSARLAPLFKELLFQIARWLALNKDEENPMVSTFIGCALELAGCGDKPEIRRLCLDGLEQFLQCTAKYHIRLEHQQQNFGIFFRKVEALTLHPDPYRRLAGLMSLTLVVGQISDRESLLRRFFFEVVFYFFLFVRKQEINLGESLTNDAHGYCEEIYVCLENILRTRADALESRNAMSVEGEQDLDLISTKFSSIDDLFQSLQKNLFSPEPWLRLYSLRMWLLLRSFLQSHLSAVSIKQSLSLLDESFQAASDDSLLRARAFSARCATLAELIIKGVVQEKHVRESKIFPELLTSCEGVVRSGENTSNAWISASLSRQVEEARREAVMQIVNLAGLLRENDRELLLGPVRSPGLVRSVIAASFNGRSLHGIDKCKGVLRVLSVDIPLSVKEFVNSHEYRFDSGRDPVYSLHHKIPIKALESFFSTIMAFLTPEEIRRELLNSIRIYHMMKFIKNSRKNSPVDTVARSRVFLQFLLDSKALEVNQIAEFLDPFNPSFDNFSNQVQQHFSKIGEADAQPLIRYLFQQSKKDHNIFASIVDLLSLFVANGKKTDAFFHSFNETFDTFFIKSHDLFLKNILNLGIIFLQEGRKVSEDQCAALCEQAFSKQNRSTNGFLALDFLGHYAKNSTHEQTLLMYRKVKVSLMDFSRDILPVILEDFVLTFKKQDNKEGEGIAQFANRIFELIKCSKMLEPFEIIFPLIRNKKRFRVELSSIIESVILEGAYELLLVNCNFCMGIFMDKSLSESLEYNIRFQMIDRVMLPLLESAKEEHLIELFIDMYPVLEKILTSDLSMIYDARQKVLSAGERACAFRILELFFRKISSVAIKDTVHLRLKGPQSQKNEITKMVISFCTATKKPKRKEFEDMIKHGLEEQAGKSYLEFAKDIIEDYYCSAYNCLVSLLVNTQTKEAPFLKFLLTSDPGKSDFVLENLIDTSHIYDFKVMTNFVSENLQDYYKSEGSSEIPSRPGVRQFVAQLTADSLFTQTINRGRLAPGGIESNVTQRQQLLNLLSTGEGNKIDMTFGEGNKMDIEKSEDKRLEMDLVNQHPIIRSFMRLVDFLDSTFKTSEGAIPDWISLFKRLFDQHTELNQRIVLLKIILNRPEIFKPYRGVFNQYLLEYLGQVNSGGSGFHYFLRDVCTTLLILNGDDDDISLNAGPILLRKLCYDGMRNLCKKLADESKPIFMLNLDVFHRIAALMRRYLLIDAGLVMMMLIYEDKKQPNAVEEERKAPTSSELSNTAVLWRLAAIGILESCVFLGIEIGTFGVGFGGAGSGGSTDSSTSLANTFSFGNSMTMTQTNTNTNTLSLSTQSFERPQLLSAVSMDIEADSKVIALHDKILLGVLANMKLKRKNLSNSAFRFAGIYLQYLAGRLPYSHATYELVKSQVLKEIENMLQKDPRGQDINLCELCRVYPEVVLNDIILVQITGYIIKGSEKTRAYLFNTLQLIYSRCFEKPKLMETVSTELTLTIQSTLDKILRDSNPNNAREFLLLLTEAAKIKDKPIKNLLENHLSRICEILLKLLKPEDLICFFNFVILLTDNYSEVSEILNTCKRYMILGLASSNEAVRNLFLDFLSNDARMMGSEEGMLHFILKDLYNPEFEQYWLTTSALLVLTLSKQSSQAREVMFDRPLAGFVSSGLFTFPTRVSFANQMSQPLIPLSLINTTQQSDMKASQEKPPNLVLREAQSMYAASQDNKEQILKIKMKYSPNAENPEEKLLTVGNEDVPSANYHPADIYESNSYKSATPSAAGRTLVQSSRLKPRTNIGEGTKNLKGFLTNNKLSFNQVSQTQDNKLRIMEQIGVRVKRPDIRKNQENLSANLRTIREYRQGELPDIQIKYSDLLQPLMVLASQDARMAQLVFVPLFIEVHQKQTPIANKANFRHLLRIIDQSQSNYQVINTIQTILYEMSLYASSVEIDPSLIAKTGTGSLSFGGAALLLEDMLAKAMQHREVDIEKDLVRVKITDGRYNPGYIDDEKFGFGDDKPLDNESLALLLNLVEIYKQMNEEDILRGLYRQLHGDDKGANDVFDLKMGKKTQLSLKKLEEMLSEGDPQFIEDKSGYRSYLNQEKRENLYCLNRWEDLVKDIKNDNEYSSCITLRDDETFIVTHMNRLRRTDRYYLLRGMLNDDNYWDAFRESAEILMADFTQKGLMEKEHPYELSLLAITMQEFDHAKFYLEKFKDKFLKNWASIKDFSGLQTKTEVVSELLRQHELKEFLFSTKHYNVEGMVGSPDLDKFFDTLSIWLKRRSSALLENFNYLSDSYHSRKLFIDTMKQRYPEYTEHQYIKHHSQVALEYTRGLLKMGHVDTADRVLTKAFNQKEKFLAGDSALDYEFASLMIRSKLEGIDRDINFISRIMDESNINAKFLNTRFSKVNQLMDYWTAKKEHTSNEFESLRFGLLKLKTKAKEISSIRDFLGPASSDSADVEQQYLKVVAEALPLIHSKMYTIEAQEALKNDLQVDQDKDLQQMRKKVLRNGCAITENVLRWFKGKAENKNCSLVVLSDKEPGSKIVETAKNFIQFCAELAKLGNVSPSSVLFALEITVDLSEHLSDHFTEMFQDCPCWIFLKWVPQIMSYLNFASGSCFLWLVDKLIQHYPEPIIHAISVAIDDGPGATEGVFRTLANTKRLREILESRFGSTCTHLKFIRAMEYLLHPDQRVKAWLDTLESSMDDHAKVTQIIHSMYKDVFTPHDELLGEGIGDFNKRFIKEMEKHIERLFGEKLSRIGEMSIDEILRAAQEFYGKTDSYCKVKSFSHASSAYKTKLSAFSGWLSEYDINNYRRHDLRIEIPGQYAGDREPVPELHVKVSYFMPEILVIQSIRKPKRLTMLGTDEKVYHCLVKGGEDLRLDQRIEQLFGLMNEVFAKDSDCSKRDFKIGTFNVIPVKKNLGVMEWVKNTITLKSVIEKEMDPKDDMLSNNLAAVKRSGFLKQLAKGKDFKEQHLYLLAAKRDIVVKEFNAQQKFFKSTYLKIAIKKKVQNAEQFIRLRKTFISNYAVLSLGSYILGVGDRHLDNFLFDYVRGNIIPIDFGFSFGIGLSLYIPELMPFRLTQNFMELTHPLGVQGLFRNSMIFALRSLKANRHLLTDACEVFIRDPLIDWVKIAKTKNSSKCSQSVEASNAGFPRDKLKIVQMKLAGHNPVNITLKELEATRHHGQVYYPQVVATVKGEQHRSRAVMSQGILPLCEQVDALIDMAVDPDVLGRAWSGWSPYV